jgi:hypothetical protein
MRSARPVTGLQIVGRRRRPKSRAVKATAAIADDRTESIYRRYAIVSDADFGEAGAQLDQLGSSG